MDNRLVQLMENYCRGQRAVFNFWPLLPIEMLRQNNIRFNDVFQQSAAMTAVAMFSFELGFSATVLPFDLNVEAEVLGARVRYNDEVDGHPVYPTIRETHVETAADIAIPHQIAAEGRLPQILDSIRAVCEHGAGRGAVGVSIPGPFTLAGQVMDMDKMFVMVLKNPGQAGAILEKLTKFLVGLRAVYVEAGATFVTIKESAASNISPKAMKKVLLPHLETLFFQVPVPQAICLPGKADRSISAILSCNPDAVVVDQACDLGKARTLVPDTIPLFSVCGQYDMLAKAQPEAVRETVAAFLETGVTSVIPPADIYPPARLENIRVFAEAVGGSQGPA